MKNVLFVVPYPIGKSPSQRFRFEQYLHLLNEHHYIIIHPFWSEKAWEILYKKAGTFVRISGLAAGMIRRLLLLFTLRKYDLIFIHREATPIGPPIWEWIAARICGKKIIYDFDDAIWMPDKTDETWFIKLLKWRSKVGLICHLSFKVSCGNKFLASYAFRFNANVVVNPTTIDTQNRHNPELFKGRDELDEQIVIGWTGSNSTIKYLSLIEEPLKKIERTFPSVVIRIIADKKPDLNFISLNFVPWNVETEIQDLMMIDIGIMPLPDDEWSKGKCGFKALQYLALQIPAVVSAVGVNNEIVEHGVNGLLCSTRSDWEAALVKLIQDRSLRQQMGARGRTKVNSHYSVSSNSDNFLSLFSV
jgi:glycosyltransferase involved in cell wall biosynthesis